MSEDVLNSTEWRHVCVDMQRLFAEDTPWHMEWMLRVKPQVRLAVERDPRRCIFTCFTPPRHVDEVQGMWRDYYRKWPQMTLEELDPALVDVIPELASFIPPARVFRKPVYSPWLHGNLDGILKAEGVETLVITGGETEVCVLATVMGAIDLGYRVVLLRDALCSSLDETHDAALQLLSNRFSTQLSVMETGDFLDTARV